MDTFPDNPREALGANNPPPDTIVVLTAELLAAAHQDLLAEWQTLKRRATWHTIDRSTGADVWTAMTADDLPVAAEIIADAREFWQKVDKRRKERKQPYDAVVNAIQAFFNPQLLDPVSLFGKALNARLDTERRRLETEARQRQAVLDEEARKHERTATLVAANAERAPIVRGVEAETVVARERQRAGELRTQAELTAPRKIVGTAGASVGTVKVNAGVIADFEKALAWAVTFAEPEIRAAVQSIVDRAVRAKMSNIPGVTIEEQETTRVSRRAR